MSLVDAGYGSDDDDDVVEVEEANVGLPPATRLRSEDLPSASVVGPSPGLSDSSIIEAQSGRGIPRQRASSPSGPVTRIRLPDVSELLGPSVSNAATTSDTQRKRPAVNGSGHSGPRPKIPRGSILQPSRVAPDTAGGLLMPPQLRGRSNVATEDLDKIFSRRQKR